MTKSKKGPPLAQINLPVCDRRRKAQKTKRIHLAEALLKIKLHQ